MKKQSPSQLGLLTNPLSHVDLTIEVVSLAEDPGVPDSPSPLQPRTLQPPGDEEEEEEEDAEEYLVEEEEELVDEDE